jgi:choline transport protein
LKCRLTKPLSGWQVMCAWQADLAAIFYLGGTIIQGMIVMNYPSYKFERWQGTLLLYAVIVIGVVFNTVLARLLPWVEGTILITHCVGFIVVLVPMVYLGPHATARDVFVKYLTLGNYNPGLSFFVGLITTVFGFLGMSKSSRRRRSELTTYRC